MGTKAFYTLLDERLRFNVGRLRKPYSETPKEARVLILVRPLAESPVQDREIVPLKNWIRKGGVAIFVSDGLKGIPRDFKRSAQLGKGHAYSFRHSSVITNKGVRDRNRAMRVLDVICRHAARRDLILFDEYHHGLTESRPVLASMGRQVKVALLLLLGAGLALTYSRARRFGAVRSLPSSETVRPGFEFVESVARLYERAHAAGLAAGILCQSFKHSLCARLGLPADAPTERVMARLRLSVDESICARVESVLRQCEDASGGQYVSKGELVDIAQEVSNLEQELQLAGNNA
jgi:hypothetical protein